MSHTERIVALIDMDCFYCQVEEKLDPNLIGKPIAVVQYNQWKGGGIIAVNYIAREKGISRQMRGDEAKEKCPEIQLPRVPQVRGKADLTKYREAGKKVAEVLHSFTSVLERASIDEAYMDLTDAVNKELEKGMPIISLEDLKNTFVVGCETADFLSNIYQNQNTRLCDDDLKLAVGGIILERIRAEVLKKTGYKCSAGIAHNKTLAKLVCSLHKPNKQTILPQQAVPEMFSKLPVRKIKSLGGKFGHSLSETLKVNYIGELVKFSEKELIQTFDEKTGRWLYNISRGIDREPVQIKLISKSIGCCKRFPGRTSLIKKEEVEHWMKELSHEISERLEEDLKENNRKGRLMTVSFSQETNQAEVSCTRSVPLKSYEVYKICQTALDILKKNCQKPDGSYHITFLGLSIGNFENVKNVRSITSYFGKTDKQKSLPTNKPEEVKPTSNRYSLSSDTNIKNILPILENTKNHIELGNVEENIIITSPLREYDGTKTTKLGHGQFMKESNDTLIYTSNENVLPTKKMVNESPSKKINYLTNNLMNEMECTFQEPQSVSESEHLNEIDLDERSNYSNSTISLDENPDDLTFYKDSLESECFVNFSGDRTSLEKSAHSEQTNSLVKDDRETDQNMLLSLQRSGSVSSIGSVENEVNLNNSSGSNSPVLQTKKPKNGFFSRFFRSSPCQRDFDTSKILGDNVLSDSEDSVESINQEIIIKSPDPSTAECSEQCEECGEMIPFIEIVTHKDYHFALKLFKENSSSTKQTIETRQKTRADIGIPKKRKASGLVIKGIESFFKKEEFRSDEPTELCLECNKKIKLIDLDNHSDYHAAKKLHLELNNSCSTDRSRYFVQSENRKDNQHKRMKNIENSNSKPDILSLFKKYN